MTNLDVAGLLTTYSKRCGNARSNEHLKEIIRELKRELNSEEIKKLRISGT